MPASDPAGPGPRRRGRADAPAVRRRRADGTTRNGGPPTRSAFAASWLKRALLTAAALAAALGASARAFAHPAGTTSVNRYVGISCEAAGALHIAYLLDFAELPAYAELDRLDADHDGTVSPAEQRAYLDARIPPLLAGWTVRVDGAPVRVHDVGRNLEIREGERGLATLRVAVEASGTWTPPDPAPDEVHVEVADPAFAERPGWREIAGDDSAAARLLAGPREAETDALAYANLGPGGPPRVDHAALTFRLRTAPDPGAGAAANAPAARASADVAVDEGLARIARAMKRARTTGSFAALAIALAVLFGAAHALSPGHGKALAAAQLVGRRARLSDAVVFGVTVAASHTSVVFVLGFLAVAIERATGSEPLLRALECASALSVLGLGLVQLSRRWHEAVGSGAPHAHAPSRRRGRAAIAALGASVGITPCPSALALLLGSIALRRYALGFAVVLGFSLGVALTVTAIGAAALAARRAVEPHPSSTALVRWLPVVSAASVTVIGVLLCASSWS